MDFTLLTVCNRSVTLELDDGGCYFADAPYALYLNGEFVRQENHNIATVRVYSAVGAQYVRADYTFHAWLG